MVIRLLATSQGFGMFLGPPSAGGQYLKSGPLGDQGSEDAKWWQGAPLYGAPDFVISRTVSGGLPDCRR